MAHNAPLVSLCFGIFHSPSLQCCRIVTTRKMTKPRLCRSFFLRSVLYQCHLSVILVYCSWQRRKETRLSKLSERKRKQKCAPQMKKGSNNKVKKNEENDDDDNWSGMIILYYERKIIWKWQSHCRKSSENTLSFVHPFDRRFEQSIFFCSRLRFFRFKR